MLQVTTTTTAAEIAAVCTTTTAAKAYFKELAAAGMERAAAKELTAAAAAIVKANNEVKAAAVKSINNEVKAARAWYRDGRKVFHAVFVAFVKSPEFKAATKGAQFKGDEVAFVERFTPVCTASGRPVKIVREYVNGVLFVRYRFVDLTRAGAFSSVLDGCLKGVKASRLDEFHQIVIPCR